MKLLIETPTWLGDTVMASPAIENLIKYFKEPEVTLIGSFTSIEVLKYHPNVIQVKVLNKKYKSLYKIAKNLGDFDIFFSFRSSFRSNLFSFFVSSKIKYKYSKAKYYGKHQVQKYNDFIQDSLGVNFEPKQLVLYQENQKKIALKFDKNLPVLGINPGASYGSSKRWNSEKFAEVAVKLSNQYNIIVFGGINETDIGQYIEKLLINEHVKNYHNFAGLTTIPELVEIISNLDLFITGDSGPMHIAASFKVNTVSLFGPTKSNETSQWKNENSIIIKKNLDCQPCMKRVCPLNHHNCMNFIEVDEVLDAIETLSD